MLIHVKCFMLEPSKKEYQKIKNGIYHKHKNIDFEIDVAIGLIFATLFLISITGLALSLYDAKVYCINK